MIRLPCAPLASKPATIVETPPPTCSPPVPTYGTYGTYGTYLPYLRYQYHGTSWHRYQLVPRDRGTVVPACTVGTIPRYGNAKLESCATHANN